MELKYEIFCPLGSCSDSGGPAWPLPGKSATMLVREISENGVKYLQDPRTEKPEIRGYFSIYLKI